MPEISRRSFVAGALAATAITKSASAVETELGRKVKALRARSADEKRKKAMLLWAVEDMAAAQFAGMTDDAAALAADVEIALEQPLGSPVAPGFPGLFPKIPTKHGNPWLDKTAEKAQLLVSSDQRFVRGSDPDAKDLNIKYGYPYIQLATEGTLLAQAFGNRETEMFGNPDLLAPMLRRFAASYEILTPTSNHLGDFGVTPHISEMYCLLKSSFPDLILPSRQKAWEQALVRNCEAMLSHPGQVFSEPGMPTETLEAMLEHPRPGDCYPNAQSHLTVGLLMCGIAMKCDRYLRAAEQGVTLMATAFYPDGATAYIDFQNECYTYHGIMIEDLARIGQVTGNPMALELVRSSRWYYPVSITPQGIAEYSSSPCWKHYWNAVKGTSTASIVASLTGCGYNATVAEDDQPSANWLAATHYVPVRLQPWWDGEMFYDRNIEGPRGRFGQHSFCATARDTRQSNRGKLTYVGNLWVEKSDMGQRAIRGWPINAGLDGAWAEVRLNGKPETVNRWDTHACLSRDETMSSMASEHFGAIASSYKLAQYGRNPIAFGGRQQWLLTSQRLVGLISVQSLADQQAYSMGIALKTVCGRGNSGIRKHWIAKDPNVYEYGALTIRLWPLGEAPSDLVTSGSIATGYTDTFSGNTGMCGILSLVDPAAAAVQQQLPSHYATGSRFHAAVEIYPTVFGAASAVKLMQGTGELVGLHVEEPGQSALLLHNPTLHTVSYSPTMAGATLHRSGEKRRTEFLPRVESVPSTPAPDTLLLPAGDLAVLRSA